MKKLLLPIITILLLSSVAFSAPQFPQYQQYPQQTEFDIDAVKERHARQERNIRLAMEQGLISRMEAFRLLKQQNRIAYEIQRAEADGFVNRWEFRRINLLLNEARRNIRREIVDDNRRADWSEWDDLPR